tara:strand:+ start:301 stop:831 length:531 start_codon:yes stop_codon:yes gene_type:complete
MKKSVGIATAIGIAIVIGIIIFQINQTMWEQVSVEEYYEKDGKVPGVVYPDNPQFLGPLQINKDKYLLGEKVFAVITGLTPMDKGRVQVYSPGGTLYETWTFDGSVKDYSKKYFEPQLTLGKNICDKNKLVGEWTIIFEGYEEFRLNFEVVDKILPNEEYKFKECNIAYEIDITSP